MPGRSKKPPLIALVVESSTEYGRRLLLGIRQFLNANPELNWVAVMEQRDLVSVAPNWLKNWEGDGVISRSTTDELKQALQQRKIPFVDITDRYYREDVVAIRSDDHEIGRMAAEHLSDCFLPHFAFCGFTDHAWSTRRYEGFLNHQALKDKFVHSFSTDWYGRDTKKWEDEETELLQWLVSLPKPIGILACNDVRGKQLIDCCFRGGIGVPEEVAIVGVDNDLLLCDFCRAPLTSVIPNAVEVGFQSAAALSKMLGMRRKSRQGFEVVVPPIGISVRRSSDIVAIDDPDLSAAIKVIREHACSGISVNEVITRINISRSSVERKFRQVLGRTPQQEIRRIQVNAVCQQLTSTDLPIEVIAPNCGFDHPEYLHVVFKRIMGTTPGEYRQKVAADF